MTRKVKDTIIKILLTVLVVGISYTHFEWGKEIVTGTYHPALEHHVLKGYSLNGVLTVAMIIIIWLRIPRCLFGSGAVNRSTVSVEQLPVARLVRGKEG